MNNHKTTIYLLPLALIIFFSRAEAEGPAKTKIGMLVPLSGSYAAVGNDNRQGIEAAMDLSKSNLSEAIVYSDSKADATTAVSEFRKLTETDGVLAVFAMRGPVGMAVNPLSQSAGVPLLGGVGNKEFASANKFAFQLWSKSDEEGAFLATKLKDQNFKKVALLTAQDDWPTAVSNGFRAGLQGSQTSIIYSQDVIPSDLDFHTIVAQIKSKAPDVIFANLALAQIGPFLKQAKEFHLSVPVYSNFWVAKKEVIEAAGLANVEGVKFVEMGTDLPKLRKFLETKYSSVPSGATLSAYAATLLLNQTLSENSNIKTREELYAAMLKQTEVKTPDGALPIKDRAVKFPLTEKVLHDGKVETVSGTK